MDIGDLTTMLDQETGFQLGDPTLLNLLITAVGTFNAWAPQLVLLSGTTLDRTLSARESRLLVLFAYATYLRGEHLKAAQGAIVHTNVAGRTDLTEIPKHLLALRKSLSDDIIGVLTDLSGGLADVSGIQVHELGATLPFGMRGVFQPWPFWYAQ